MYPQLPASLGRIYKNVHAFALANLLWFMSPELNFGAFGGEKRSSFSTYKVIKLTQTLARDVNIQQVAEGVKEKEKVCVSAVRADSVVRAS